MSKTSLLVIIGLCTNNSTAVLSWLSSPVRETLGMNTSHTQRCDKLTETLDWSCLPVAQRWTDCQTTWIIWVTRSQSNRMAVGSLRQTELSAIMFKTSNKGMNELGFIPLVELQWYRESTRHKWDFSRVLWRFCKVNTDFWSHYNQQQMPETTDYISWWRHTSLNKLQAILYYT